MGYQNKAQYNWMPLWRGPIYHDNEDSTVKTVAEYQSDLTLTTASPYLALSGEAWGVCCEDLGKYSPCSNSTILYVPISWDVLLHYYIACKTNISWYVYDNQLQWVFPSRKTTMTTRLLLWYTKLFIKCCKLDTCMMHSNETANNLRGKLWTRTFQNKTVMYSHTCMW